MRPLGRKLVQETHLTHGYGGTGYIIDGPPSRGRPIQAQKEIPERTSDPSPEREMEDGQTNRKRSRKMRSKVKKKG